MHSAIYKIVNDSQNVPNNNTYIAMVTKLINVDHDYLLPPTDSSDDGARKVHSGSIFPDGVRLRGYLLKRTNEF